MTKLALTHVFGQIVRPGDSIRCKYNGKPRDGIVESIETDNSGVAVPSLRVKVADGYRMFKTSKIVDFVKVS